MILQIHESLLFCVSHISFTVAITSETDLKYLDLNMNNTLILSKSLNLGTELALAVFLQVRYNLEYCCLAPF